MKSMRSLGFAAVLATVFMAFMGVASASAAEPKQFNADQYPANLAATNLQTFDFGPGYRFCEMTLTSELSGPTREAIASLTPNCANVNTNGCQLVLHPAAGTFDIGGSKCTTGITVKLEPFSPNCVEKILPQSGLPAAYWTTGEGSKASIFMEISAPFRYKPVNNQCGLEEEGKEYTGGSWSMSNFSIQAHNKGGTQIGAHATSQVGIRLLEGFTAETYSVAASGDQNAGTPDEILLNSIPIKCGGAHFSTTMSSTSLLLEPVSAAYAECKMANIFPTEIKMNGCNYSYSAENKGEPFLGGMSVKCGAKSIEILVRNAAKTHSKCRIVIGPQSFSSGVTYTNVGTGFEGGFKIGAKITSLAATVSNAEESCPIAAGSYTNGSYTATDTLFGMAL
ncbi:MAG TPA: hypothetical protein VII45_13665 [Solirubrobacterales bacterium]